MHIENTGVDGLDEVLAGGLPSSQMHLIQGDPGVGKTTAALQFLLDGRQRGLRTLYVTLSETQHELTTVADSHGWSLDGIAIYQLGMASEAEPEAENTLYVPSEIELGERMAALLGAIDDTRPQRLVIDSCSELRLLAGTPLRFRRHILALKERLAARDCTSVLLENPLVPGGDVLLQSLVHGVIEMEQLSPLYGAERRRLRVIKMRGVKFRGGYHDFVIRRGGVEVFPRLVASEHREPFRAEQLSSGVGELDALLGGGLDRGTCTLFMGPAGGGKSALSTLYVHAAAARDEHAAVFIFDEGIATFIARAKALKMDVEPAIDAGVVSVRQIDPAELSPGELVHLVRQDVEERGARVVVIDSLNGYMNAMPEETFVILQLHELVTYLRQRGVVTILVVAQHGLVGPNMDAAIDISYLSDTVVVTRYFEDSGRVRKAISVLKKRSGRHADTISELTIGTDGIAVSAPLERFRGVLTGMPLVVDDHG